jgi:hypothetical protein
VLERHGPTWRVLGRQADGQALTQCELDLAQRQVHCEAGVRTDQP